MGKRILLSVLLGFAAVSLAADPQEVLLQAFREGVELLTGVQEELTAEVEEYQEVQLPSGLYRSEASVTVSWDAETVQIRPAGIGETPREALEDAAGYLTRALPGVLLEVPGLLPPPRVELAAPGQLYILTEEPVTSRSAEFLVKGPDERTWALLRTAPSGYWESRETEAALLEAEWGRDPWRRYLAAEVLCASGKIVPGMPVEPVNRLGVTLALQGGAALHPGGTLAAAISLQASANSLLRFVSGTIVLAGHFFAGGEQLIMLQGGWEVPLPLPRSISREPSMIDLLALHLSFAGGPAWDTRSTDTLLTGTAEVSLQAYASPRWKTGISAKWHMIGPAGGTHGDWYGVPQISAAAALRL